MIKVDVSAFQASLDKYRLQTKVKLKDTVWEVMRLWADTVIEITPYGDSVKFANRYQSRQNLYGWRSQPGLLLGNWNISINNADSKFYGNSFSDQAGGMVKSKLVTNEDRFNLGDTIYLSNSTPYLVRDNINAGGSIEGGYSSQSPNGLKDPLLQAIMALHKVAYSKLN
jgi:hypothetical protein